MKNFHHFLPTKPTKTIFKTPSYLYLKNRIFYYRYRIPKKFSELNIELRFSLHTSYKNQATKMATSVHNFTMYLLEIAKKMKRSETTIVELKPILKQAVKDEIAAMLAEPGKKPISYSEAKKRINGYFRWALENDLNSPFPAPLMLENEDSIRTKFDKIEKELSKPENLELVEQSEELKKFKEDYETNRNLLDIITLIGESYSHSVNTLENFDAYFFSQLAESIQKNIFKPEEISNENARMIAKNLMLLKAHYIEVIKARWKGDYKFEQQFYTSDYTPYPPYESKLENSEKETKNSLLLSELITKYIETNISDGKWVLRTVPDHRNRITALVQIIGDKEISAITRDDIRSFRETLRKLPPRWRRKIENEKLTIQELVNANYPQTLSIKTINDMVEAVSSLFAWAIAENLMTFNPATRLGLKDEEAPIDKREAFSEDDINKIFFDGDFKPKSFTNPAFYWCPLISLYTGMRLEEIAQLHCEDIYKEEGLYVFDIKKESSDGLQDKILKTINAQRKIPIHSKLIELGLIDFIDSQKQSGHIRLFNQLNKTDKSPKYGKQVSKQFQNLLKRKNITGKKSFHSLRHTFSNFFKKHNLHNDLFRQAFGHDIGHLAGQRHGDRFSPKDIYEQLISKLEY